MTRVHSNDNTAIVILGAGASRRFQGCKLLARIGEKTLLHIAIEKAASCAGEHIYLVTGGWRDEITQALADPATPDINCIENSDWQKGLGHSIAAAVRQLQDHYSQLLFMAGDQIAVTGEDLEIMMQQANSHKIIAAYYQGQAGVPALFPRIFYPQLLTLEGDRGAKKILAKNSDRVIVIDNPRAAIDIDKQQDLQQWLSDTPQASDK